MRGKKDIFYDPHVMNATKGEIGMNHKKCPICGYTLGTNHMCHHCSMHDKY